MPIPQPNRPTTSSPRRHPLERAVAPDNEICLADVLAKKQQVQAFNAITMQKLVEERIRLELIAAARRERQRLLDEKNAARAELLRRIADKDARMLAQEKKEARRLKREARKAYKARVKEVGDTTKHDPFAWMPKAQRQQEEEAQTKEEEPEEEKVVVPQPIWLDHPIV